MTPLPRSVADRLTVLVLGSELPVAAAIRALADGSDGGPPVQVSRNGADRVIRDARAAADARADVPTIAARMLGIVSRELASLEASDGPKDLDRLAKLASTLATLERLQPKAAPQSEVGLLSLREQSPNEHKTEGLAQLRTAEG